MTVESRAQPPATTERGPWDGVVAGVTTHTFRWGTHTFVAELRLFEDGEGHVRVGAPSDPPPCAEEIVRDGLASGAADAAVAAALAEGWGIDVEEVTTDAD